MVGSRWFSGFAAAIVLLGGFAAAGLWLGGVGESAAAEAQGMGQIRVKFPWPPEPGRGEEWIELESFQWGVRASSTQPPSGPPRASEVVITKVVDATSLRLHQAMAEGQHFPEVTIDLCNQDCDKKTKYMEVTLKNAYISNYTIQMGDDLPLEEISFVYDKIELTYHAQDKKNEPTGTMKWDCTSWPGCVPY
jgi:type VI secretion system Hcp family effector